MSYEAEKTVCIPKKNHDDALALLNESIPDVRPMDLAMLNRLMKIRDLLTLKPPALLGTVEVPVCDRGI